MLARKSIRHRTWGILAVAVIGASALAEDRAPPAAEYRKMSGRQASFEDSSPGSPPSLAQAVPVQRSRYKTLLRKITVERDQQSYGDFYDYGYYTGTSYMEYTDLPVGYWVYVAPHWLIYKEDLNNPQPQPPAAWGVEQAIGAPNTPNAGDINTAWASASADGQREWLELTYESPVEAVGVMVYETYNPGAVDCVTAYAGNEQVQVWAGKDPTEPGKPMGVSVMGFSTAVTTNRIRLNIDSPRVAGWNEIDAVGLIDKQGKVHWAVGASASSSYATGSGGGAPDPAALRGTRDLGLRGVPHRLSEDAPGASLPGAPDIKLDTTFRKEE